ncbi:hypothetical protein [Paraburkholderia terricola]|uniref:Gfo/Idh/MocA-like oxidoreductase N-terminal domain-containing protein n=1 Tax=Paraburkholderia terricola TaxID=169427 RepID=A0ABU1LQL4_9BURK|nr:hypothetical protein [Paraburkholderia terricola]MDR6409028.1 hypothetical protein [Paraburkholderia terricola]MDR6482071.1 hypothetical protein [Paraburkholderia terricola]
MRREIRVAVIGTGFMGKAHALAYRALPNAFPNLPRPWMVAVADVSETDISFHRKYHFAAAHFSFPGELITCYSTIPKPLTRVSAGDDMRSCARSDSLRISLLKDHQQQRR